jgi:hypothetical protein
MTQVTRGSSLHELEGTAPAGAKARSILGATLRAHRRTPIERLGTEALRFLLEEGGSAEVLLRVAIDRLERDPFQGGDFHPGDLLVALLDQPPAVWLPLPELRARAHALAEDAGDLADLLEPEDRVIVARAVGSFKAQWVNRGGGN